MKYSLREIPSGLAGTNETVRVIAEGVHNDLRRPVVRLTASRLVQSAGVKSKDHLSEAEALYSWISRNIRYQKDPVGIETVQSPEITLELRCGDCDDHVGLMVAMAMSLGIPGRYRVIGYNDNHLVHIFPELLIGSKWIAADTTEPQHGFGWRPPKFPVEKIYNLDGEVSNMTISDQVAPGVGGLSPNQPVIKRAILDLAIRQKVREILEQNWQAGNNNRRDLRTYIEIIDGQNFPTKSPLITEPVRAAIVDWINYLDANQIGSLKAEDYPVNMGELNGFLSSLWGGVKSVVKSVTGAVAASGIPIISQAAAIGRGILFPSTTRPDGGSQDINTDPGRYTKGSKGGAPIRISPNITLPPDLIQTQIAPGAAQAFGSGLGGSTIPMIAMAAVLAVVLLKK